MNYKKIIFRISTSILLLWLGIASYKPVNEWSKYFRVSPGYYISQWINNIKH